jgi:uncharacterized protein YndB with AHSA1/START domain
MTEQSAPEPVALASVTREIRDGRTIVVFGRGFPQQRGAVWQMLTAPELLALWAPYTADHDLGTVGKLTFTMLGDDVYPDTSMPGVVLVADRPELLEHSLADDALLWRLEATPGGTRLTLRHTLADPLMASAAAAGWHLCLEVAADRLSGGSAEPVRGPAAMKHGWEDLNGRYAEVLGVEASVVTLPEQS